MENYNVQQLPIKSQDEMKEMEDNQLDRIVQDHEKRIVVLEQNHDSLDTKIQAIDTKMQAIETKTQAIETGQMRIESTLLREFNEQKALLNKHLDEQAEQNRQLLQHSLGLKSENNSNMWKLLLQIFGAGGLLAAASYGIFQVFV